MKVIGIGDNVCDKYEHLKMMFPGGQAMNFSVYAKMLGADASYMGVFGRDEVADHVIATLDELQVDHSHCRQYDGENGCARVTLVDGDRVFLGSNRGGITKEKPVDLTEEDLVYIKGFSHVHTSNNSHFDSQLAKVKSTGVPLSYDFSGRWNEEDRVARVAPYADYAFLSCGSISEEEAMEICKKIHEAGCKMVIATRGSYGALFYDGVGFFSQPPKLVKAIDTLGAGDSFATAFLLSFTESMEREPEKMKMDRSYYETELKKALASGAEFASKTCMVQGAFGHGKPFGE
ncbi:MAG: fructoselysine 6-kinase [Lachnospiraceae bacterium]|nr:fructoselysine 6-kinase [Lachnospiraceae bacterium]